MKKISKWDAFKSKEYTLEDMGRAAIFLLPSLKLKKKVGKETLEKNLESFLKKHFGGGTTSLVPKFGFWVNGEKVEYDESREYKVSFVGKERIPLLIRKVASIARLMNEKAVYFEAGQYACLIKPKTKK